MHPLFQTGTFRCDDDAGPAAVMIDGRDEPSGIDGGDVDMQ